MKLGTRNLGKSGRGLLPAGECGDGTDKLTSHGPVSEVVAFRESCANYASVCEATIWWLLGETVPADFAAEDQTRLTDQ